MHLVAHNKSYLKYVSLPKSMHREGKVEGKKEVKIMYVEFSLLRQVFYKVLFIVALMILQQAGGMRMPLNNSVCCEEHLVLLSSLGTHWRQMSDEERVGLGNCPHRDLLLVRWYSSGLGS